MKKYSIILPTNFPPKNNIAIGAIEIKRNKRVKVAEHHKNSFTFYDSIIIKYDAEENLKEWLIFHSFIFNELVLMNVFDNHIEIAKLDEECSKGIDYFDIKSLIYFAKDIDAEKISYSDLYNKFLNINLDDRDLVINYLLDIGGSRASRLDPVRDYSYWQMVVYYSIYERIIGEQPSSCESLPCRVCGKTPKHRPKTDEEWNRQRLAEIVKNVDLAEEYLNVILAVKKLIRNKTVHEGLHPTAKHVIQNETKIEYDINKAVEEFGKNRDALLALKLSMREVVRSLLLNKIFGFVFFPHIGRIVSHMISFKSSNNV